MIILVILLLFLRVSREEFLDLAVEGSSNVLLNLILIYIDFMILQ